MTQQPVYPPQGYPQPQVQQQPAPQQYAQPQYPAYPPQTQQPAPQQPAPQQPAPQQFAQPGYPQAQPAAAAPPLAEGGIDEFFNQRSAGSGPGLSWSNKDGSKKPVGHWYMGAVARDIHNGDVQQQTNPQGVPQTFRDGSPKFQMLVPLKQIQSADGNTTDYEQGEATWYVKGQARDELVRAMAEAGCGYTTPKAGDTVVIQLSGRRSSGQGFQPANVFAIQYVSANAGQPPQPAPQAQTVEASPAPVQPPAQAQPPAQGQIPAQVAPVQEQPMQPAPAGGVPEQAAQPVQQVQQQVTPQPPPGLDPAAQQILAQLTGGQQAS